jgi:tetratricopeptide (TPR) repeat protein
MQRVLDAGLESLRNGRLADAAAAFQEVLRSSPNHPDAHYLLAHTALLGGQLADAERHVGLALQAAPDQPDFHLLRGNIAQRAADLQRAEEAYREALRIAPGYAEAQLNLGNALGEQGRADEALAAYAAALELKPDLLAAALNRAALLARLGRGAEALPELERLAARHPESTELLRLRAQLDIAAGGHEAALGPLREILKRDPADRAARLKLAQLLAGMHRHGGAIAELTQLRAQQPGWAEAHAAYADACMHAGREAEALAGYDAVLRLEPAHFAARASRALLLGHRGERETALASLEALDAESPRQPHVLNGIGLQLEALGRVREAAARFADAYAVDPGFAAANANLANACLLLGDFARGWRHQGNKWRGDELKKHPRSFACPLWQGEPLAGRSLLVWSEQGLGDQIMYAGMFADLLARGAGGAFECHPRLQPLFARSFAQATVLSRGDERLAGMQFDFHAPMSALGEYLRAGWDAFPRHRGYLKPDTARRAAWRARLDALGAGLKVGISWRGGTAHTGGAARSSSLADWGALLGQQRARFVSLQYGKCEPEIERLRAGGLALAHWPEAIDDLEECAALVSELDLVVSVTTTVIHLAGALGKPVWVLVPARPGWRYLLEGEAMPWYPSARLLRQGREGDWLPVISRAAGDLAAALAARR